FEIIGSLLKAPTPKVHSLFVAPEYLFANPIAEPDHRVCDERQVDQTRKVGIECFIQSLSERYKGMILIPGSVAWKKALERDEDMYVKNKRTLSAREEEELR